MQGMKYYSIIYSRFFFINHDIRIPWWTNQDDSWKVGPRFFGPWPKSGLVTGGTKKTQQAVPALRSIPGSFQAFIFPDHRDVKARNQGSYRAPQGSYRAIRYSGFFGVRGPWVRSLEIFFGKQQEFEVFFLKTGGFDLDHFSFHCAAMSRTRADANV